MKSHILLLAIATVLVSCVNDVETTTLSPMESHDAPKGHFRGTSIGDRIDDILKREPIDSVVFSLPNQVVYNIGTDTCVLQVSYEFESDTLHTIQADWFFLEIEDLEVVQQEVRSSFDTRYARQEGDGDYEVWHSVRANGKMIEFTLLDASIEYGRPVLSLTIHNFQ